MVSEIKQAITQICEDKGLSYEAVMETIESALGAAYRKDYGNKMQNIEVEFDVDTGDMKVFDVKTVVENLPEEEIEKMRLAQAEEAERKNQDGEERREWKKEDEEDSEEAPLFNPKTEIMISDAQVLKMGSEIGDVMRISLEIPGEFGRMAAMTAKQVITQKLREAEREIIFNEYKEQEGEVLIGTVQRREKRIVLVDIGSTVGILLPEDQIPTEQYNSGDKIKVFVREVSLGTRGPQILLSRTSEELVRILFEVEIPEVAEGTVLIKGIARAAGSRTKIAVHTVDDSIDPIGACIGQRGMRIQTVISELDGEKIDVIEWSGDVDSYITNALSPAKIAGIELNEELKEATVYVDAEQLSLAIGKGGQNVRLASQLTEWKLNIVENLNSEAENDDDEDQVESEDKDTENEIEPFVSNESSDDSEEVAKEEVEIEPETEEIEEEEINNEE